MEACESAEGDSDTQRTCAGRGLWSCGGMAVCAGGLMGAVSLFLRSEPTQLLGLPISDTALLVGSGSHHHVE